MRESAHTLFQVRPAHHIVSTRQAYAHLPCFFRSGYLLPPRPSETLQRRPRSGRAPTPPAQAPRTPHRTPPATARHGPAHAAAPAAARASPAPHSPTLKSMGRKSQHSERSDYAWSCALKPSQRNDQRPRSLSQRPRAAPRPRRSSNAPPTLLRRSSDAPPTLLRRCSDALASSLRLMPTVPAASR